MSSPSESPAAPAAPPSRKRHLGKKLALAAGSLLFCVLLFELTLRVLGFGNVEIYESDPVVFWRLKPNQRCYTKVDHKPVRINSHGTRGPEFSVAKPPGTIRILSLGDSRTFGWGLTEEETYSARLERALQERVGSSPRIEVINAGVNAWSYAQLLIYFRERGLAFRPDYVIMAEANAWTQFSDRTDPEFARQFMRRVQLKNLLRRSAIYHWLVEVQLQEFYAYYRTKFIPVAPQQDTMFKEQQQRDPDAFFREAIVSLCQTAQSNGVKPVLIYLPAWEPDNPAAYTNLANIKKATSAQLGVPYIDYSSDILPGGSSLYLEADPVHFNARGNEIVARRLTELLGPQIKP
jgi:lysophospholipase L1-like esterase